MKKIVIISAALIISGGVAMMAIRFFLAPSKESLQKPTVLLLGASVGQAWNISNFPKRTMNAKYNLEMIPVYAFDKTPGLEEIFIRPKRTIRLDKKHLLALLRPASRKPDIIIIKECSAYFPGDLARYKSLIEKWIPQCQTAGMKTILATVVPVTEGHAQKKPERLQGLLEFNDWIREYTEKNGIKCLDLEKALRISETERSLRTDLAASDGLHLNKSAYNILDKVLAGLLSSF